MLSIPPEYTRLNIHVNARLDDNLRVGYTCAYISSMNIGDRLDEAMKKAGYRTQNALATASGVPQPTIARILKGGGKRGPESETIKRLASACGVTFSWLNGETSEPPMFHPHSIKQEQATYATPSISLVYVSPEELQLITNYRESTDRGKQTIILAGETSPKNTKGIRKIKTSTL